MAKNKKSKPLPEIVELVLQTTTKEGKTYRRKIKPGDYSNAESWPVMEAMARQIVISGEVFHG